MTRLYGGQCGIRTRENQRNQAAMKSFIFPSLPWFLGFPKNKYGAFHLPVSKPEKIAFEIYLLSQIMSVNIPKCCQNFKK